MDNNPNTVYVIVVTYRGHQWYDRCFQSLRASSIPVQIIVVDNASNDGSVDYIRTYYPEVHIIESSVNLGFGQANNKGIRFALDQGCEYVFLLNQDAWVDRDSILTLINIHQSNPQFGILSPMHLTPDRAHIEKGVLTYVDDFKITERTLMEDLYFDRLGDIYETLYINAAAWLIDRRTLDIVGGFDPLFFQYGEDDNYMRRVIYHGLKIGICPKSQVVHDCDNRGVRVYTSEEQERRRLLPLLIRFTDITNNESLRKYLFYLLRKVMVSFIKGNKKLATNYRNDFIFLKRMRRSIKKSVSTNLIPGQSWL